MAGKVLPEKPQKTSRNPKAKAPPKKVVRTSARRVKPRAPQSVSQEVFDLIGAAIYMSRGGRFVYVSPAYAKWTGYLASELIGAEVLPHIHPDDRKRVKTYLSMPGRKKAPQPYEYRWIRKDGEIIWFLETSGPGQYAGEPVVQASVMDLTVHKQATADMELSESRLQSLLDIFRHEAKDADALLAYALRHAISLTGSSLGFIGYYRESGKQVQIAAWSPEAMKDCAVKDKPEIYDVRHAGLWAEALRRREPLIINDYAAKHRGKKGLPEGHVALSRLVSVPIVRGKKIAGLVCVGNKATPYDASDVRQLMVLMDAVWSMIEHKQVEDILSQSEQRYRTVLDELGEGYNELDLEGNFTFINEAGARNIGYTTKEMLGTNVRAYLAEGEAEKLSGLLEDMLKTGQPVRACEVAVRNKQQVTRYFEMSGALICDEAGQPTGFRAITRDVTARKWTEEALLQSEAKYRSITESIGQAYFETDLRGFLTFFNDKVITDLGYTRDELLRMTHRDIQDEKNAAKTREAFARVLKTGLPNPSFVYEAICKDGSHAAFEISISLMRDSEGKAIGFRGLSRDVTERKKMEDALRASEERSRTIIATIPDPYFETDLKGHFIYINSAFQTLVGFSLDELRQMDYRTYLDKKTADAVYSLYNTVYKTGLTMKNAELQLLTRSRETRLVNLSVSLIRDPRGEASGFHGIMRDVTEKRAAEALILESEQKMRTYSETLEKSVSERTAQLEKAKVAAEAANRAKSDFLANISHEFQTPLNSIIGFTKVLKDRMFGELNDKQEEFLRYIAEAGDTLSRLLNEIIEVSKSKAERMRLHVTAVSISEALIKTVRLLDAQIQEKNQVLTTNIELDADVTIEADDEKVRQIFFHLLSNAVKYSPSGGRITVGARRVKSASGVEGVAVAFTDEGPGIRETDMPRIFRNFGRLESSYARETGGIGVGLFLTRQLAELHAGDVTVESQYGKGSRFIVFLPLKHSSGSGAE